MTTTMAAFDCQSNPNHITRIGAMPMIGSAEMKLPIGISPRRRKSERSQASATRKPAADPISQPGTAARTKVCAKSAPSTGSDANSRAMISDGAGKSTVGTFKPTQITSHRNTSVNPNSSGTAAGANRVSTGGRPSARLQMTLANHARAQTASASVITIGVDAPRWASISARIANPTPAARDPVRDSVALRSVGKEAMTLMAALPSPSESASRRA